MWLVKLVHPHILLQPGLQLSPTLSHHIENVQMIQLAVPGFDHYLIFSGPPKYAVTLQKTRSSLENMPYTFPRVGWVIFSCPVWMFGCHYGYYTCFSLFREVSSKLLFVIVREEGKQRRLH